jgi:hypothetical protein
MSDPLPTPSTLLETWDMPTSSAAIFPRAEVDWLENKVNYYVWSVQMKNMFDSCEMMGVVDGSEKILLGDSAHIVEHWIWKRKDNLAKAMITQCMKSDLVIKFAHAKHTKESWEIFASKFSQTSTGLIMLWLRCLSKQLPSGSDVFAHVNSFREAIHYLANAEFEISSYIAAAILLSTLPSNPQDPACWNNHVAGMKIDKSTTALLSVINCILEEN